MLSYLIITYILSVIGYLFYRFFILDKVKLKAQRAALHAILFSCLIVPLIVSFFVTELPFDKRVVDQEENYIAVCDNFCPEEEAINQCYDLAINDEHFCNCVSVEKENIIVYEGNAFLNFFISNEKILKNGFLSLGSLILFLLILKLVSLKIIIHNSKKTKILIKGEKYFLLKPNINLPVASFKIFNKYIIWDERLNYLSDEEKRAIFYHEMAHIKNNDTWFKIFENLLSIIWITNPIFYLIKKELQNLSEFLADEFAVNKIGDVNFYASLLLKIKKQEALALAQQFKNESLTKIRIQKLLISNPVPESRSVVPKLILTLFAFAVISVYSLDFLHKENDKYTVYKKLFDKNHETGKSVFCKHCLLEEIKKL